MDEDQSPEETLRLSYEVMLVMARQHNMSAADIYNVANDDEDDLFRDPPVNLIGESVEDYLRRLYVDIRARLEILARLHQPLAQCQHCGTYLSAATEESTILKFRSHHRTKHPECGEFAVNGGAIPARPIDPEKARLN